MGEPHGSPIGPLLQRTAQITRSWALRPAKPGLRPREQCARAIPERSGPELRHASDAPAPAVERVEGGARPGTRRGCADSARGHAFPVGNPGSPIGPLLQRTAQITRSWPCGWQRASGRVGMRTGDRENTQR